MTHPAAILNKVKIFAGKELGQNFIADPGYADKILDRAGIDPEETVLEIGPGLGALTISCACRVNRMIAVEKDFRLVPLLEKELSLKEISNVEVIREDFLKLAIHKIALTKKLVVMGNLPYNISSQILFKLIQEREHIKRAILMFQKEVAQRICAQPGTREFSRLSAVVQYCASIRDVLDLKPECFFPKPEVDSRVIEIRFDKETPFDKSMEAFHFDVIRAAFSKRRKTLKNSLSGAGLPVDKTDIPLALDSAGIDPQRRAETLSTDEFISLSRCLEKYSGKA